VGFLKSYSSKEISEGGKQFTVQGSVGYVTEDSDFPILIVDEDGNKWLTPWAPYVNKVSDEDHRKAEDDRKKAEDDRRRAAEEDRRRAAEEDRRRAEEDRKKEDDRRKEDGKATSNKPPDKILSYRPPSPLEKDSPQSPRKDSPPDNNSPGIIARNIGRAGWGGGTGYPAEDPNRWTAAPPHPTCSDLPIGTEPVPARESMWNLGFGKGSVVTTWRPNSPYPRFDGPVMRQFILDFYAYGASSPTRNLRPGSFLLLLPLPNETRVPSWLEFPPPK